MRSQISDEGLWVGSVSTSTEAAGGSGGTAFTLDCPRHTMVKRNSGRFGSFVHRFVRWSHGCDCPSEFQVFLRCGSSDPPTPTAKIDGRAREASIAVGTAAAAW